ERLRRVARGLEAGIRIGTRAVRDQRGRAGTRRHRASVGVPPPPQAITRPATRGRRGGPRRRRVGVVATGSPQLVDGGPVRGRGAVLRGRRDRLTLGRDTTPVDRDNVLRRVAVLHLGRLPA